MAVNTLENESAAHKEMQNVQGEWGRQQWKDGQTGTPTDPFNKYAEKKTEMRKNKVKG